MDKVKCPYCKKEQKEKPIKNWKYANTEVSRYKCNCGKLFNYYSGSKNNWTIPKPVK